MSYGGAEALERGDRLVHSRVAAKRRVQLVAAECVRGDRGALFGTERGARGHGAAPGLVAAQSVPDGAFRHRALPSGAALLAAVVFGLRGLFPDDRFAHGAVAEAPELRLVAPKRAEGGDA